MKSMGEGYAGEWRRWYAGNGLPLICYGVGEEGGRNLARGWENRACVLRTQSGVIAGTFLPPDKDRSQGGVEKVSIPSRWLSARR